MEHLDEQRPNIKSLVKDLTSNLHLFGGHLRILGDAVLSTFVRRFVLTLVNSSTLVKVSTTAPSFRFVMPKLVVSAIIFIAAPTICTAGVMFVILGV